MKYIWILFVTLLMALFSSVSKAKIVNYDRSNERVYCLYNFIVEDGTGASYFSHNLYGRMQYVYNEKGFVTYVVDFKEGLDLLPNLDRSINHDIQLHVTPSNCKGK